MRKQHGQNVILNVNVIVMQERECMNLWLIETEENTSIVRIHMKIYFKDIFQ